MNRYDLIQGLARDIATNVHADPAKRDVMADDLIKLCTAIVAAIGKGIAVQGESNLNEAHDMVFELDTESIDYSDAEVKRHRAEFEAEQSEAVIKAHAAYLAGESMQSEADHVMRESTNPAVNIDRYPEPAPWDWCACRHGPGVHSDAGCIGEQHNRIACEGGPCPGFRAVQAPTPWTHVDRRPAYFRDMDERGVLYIPPDMQASGRGASRPPVTDLWGGACVKCGQTGRHANSCQTTKTIKDGS